MKRQIDTRRNEVRFFTSDLNEMLCKYIASTVSKKWTEDFMDESTGEVVSIDRYEVLFSKGTYIDRDVLARIQFSMQADGIKEVEVSNQKRLVFENKYSTLYPWTVVAQIGAKKVKFLLYASSMQNVLDILNDYIELNYANGYSIVQAKEMESCVILTDNLRKADGETEQEYLKGNMTLEEYAEEIEDEQQASDAVKKYYKIDVKCTFSDETEELLNFIVFAVDTERAMMVISQAVRKEETETKNRYEARGEVYEIRAFKLCIEKIVPMAISDFVPKDFSMVYND